MHLLKKLKGAKKKKKIIHVKRSRSIKYNLKKHEKIFKHLEREREKNNIIII